MTSQSISTESKVELEFFKESPPLESDGQATSNDWISCVKFFNEFVVAGNYSGYLQKYLQSEMASEEKLFSFPVKSFDVSTETSQIAVASKNGEIRILDPDFKLLGICQTEHVEKVTWNPSGTTFVVGTYMGSLQLCKLTESQGYIHRGNKKQEVDAQEISVQALEISHTDAISEVLWPSLETLITSSMDHNICVVDLESSKV